MLFAHIADTHLGYRQFNLEERERDFYRSFHDAVDKMILEGVELVIHAGDLFDEPRPPIRALVEAKKGIVKLRKKGIKVVMVPGNHDMIMRKGSMAPHAIFDGVDILTIENPYVVVDDVFIGGVPYLSKSYKDILLEKINALGKEASEYNRRILVLHQGIDKYLPFEHEVEIGELPKTFDYYALGHVHSRVEEGYEGGWLCYSGSTEIWRPEEARDWEKNGKGFLISDTENFRPKRINLEGIRTFLKAEITSEDDIQKIRSMVAEHIDPILSLNIKSDGDFNYLQGRIKDELAKSVLYLAIRKKHLPKEEMAPKGGVLDVKELIFEALNQLGEGDRTYAYEVFKELSKSDVEGAMSLTEDFYEKWKQRSRK
jgi:DNA repair exonuclease SbcCD nuclease subunit